MLSNATEDLERLSEQDLQFLLQLLDTKVENILKLSRPLLHPSYFVDLTLRSQQTCSVEVCVALSVTCESCDSRVINRYPRGIHQKCGEVALCF